MTTTEQQQTSASSATGTGAGGWFVLWGMCLLAVWMSPAPAAPLKYQAVRVALVLVGLGTLIAAALRKNDRARARAAFLRGAGAFALAAGLGTAGSAFVIQTTALRAAVLTVAGVCLLVSLLIDLARESSAEAPPR
jgi:hypothetical protein